ncbi:MAG TPA: XRE family transcriptional regulator [Flavobacteriales bacterium]|nr:XRE family transcriptional regulator [Flavobacteriales bacterium]
MTVQNLWPYGNNIQDDGNIVINQRMIYYLLGRKNIPKNRSMIALGIEVQELRDTVGMGLAELAVLSGLDRGFLAILESGKAIPSELTEDVLMALANALAEGQDVRRVQEYLSNALSERVNYLVAARTKEKLLEIDKKKEWK